MQLKNYHTGRSNMALKKTYDFTVNNIFNRYDKINNPLRIILALTVRDELRYGEHIFMQLNDAVKRDYDEIVVLDDGSRDGTWDILQDYARKYNNIRIKRNEVNSILAKGENRWITLIRECEKYHPTWIHFRACDQLHSKLFNEKMREIVTYFHEHGAWLIKIPLVHLWRSEGWFRYDDVWLQDYMDHSRRQLWRFYKDYEYKPNRTIAALHLGGHLPNKISPYNITPTYNINSYFKQTSSKQHWRIVVLHYGHTTHEKKEVKFRLTMEAASKGVSYGCPSPNSMPHPRYWLRYNGYKGFHEFNLHLRKIPQIWFDRPVNYAVPEIKSFYKVIAEYRLDRAKEYQALFEANKDKIPIIVKE